jgi:hypothetical protein
MMMSVTKLVPSAAGELGKQRLAQFGAALAAVFCEEEHQVSQRADVGPLNLLSALLLGFDEACLGQHREMRREGALRQARCVNKFAGRKTVGFMPDEQAKGVETSGVRERSEGG